MSTSRRGKTIEVRDRLGIHISNFVHHRMSARSFITGPVTNVIGLTLARIIEEDETLRWNAHLLIATLQLLTISEHE